MTNDTTRFMLKIAFGETVLMYDPPMGWVYGFPKIYLPLEGETIVDTLDRDGYNVKITEEIDKHIKWFSVKL